MKVTSNYFCHKNDLSYKPNTLGPLCLWQCFNGITLPDVRPMDVEADWLGAIKQS